MESAGRHASTGAVILHWPDDADQRADLRRAGRPRLLLLAAGAVPPVALDALEDWLWTPADERDLYARLRRLEARVVPLILDAVELDDDGTLHAPAGTVVLPAVEAALVATLLAPPRRVRTRTELAEAAWAS